MVKLPEDGINDAQTCSSNKRLHLYTEMCRLEEEFDKDAVCHQFCSTCTVSVLPRKLCMGYGLGDFKVGGQIIQTVKYADDLVLMAKEETVLQGMTDKLIETGTYYGIELNVEKTKVMRISRQPSPVAIKIEQKQLENVKCFKYLGSM